MSRGIQPVERFCKVSTKFEVLGLIVADGHMTRPCDSRSDTLDVMADEGAAICSLVQEDVGRLQDGVREQAELEERLVDFVLAVGVPQRGEFALMMTDDDEHGANRNPTRRGSTYFPTRHAEESTDGRDAVEVPPEFGMLRHHVLVEQGYVELGIVQSEREQDGEHVSPLSHQFFRVLQEHNCR